MKKAARRNAEHRSPAQKGARVRSIRVGLCLAALASLTAVLARSSATDGAGGPAPVLAAAAADPMAGVTTEMLGSLASATTPGYSLVFLRITMQPGAAIPAHSHPGDVVAVVQAGEFGTSFVRGQGTVTRAAVGGASPSRETLEAGDSAVLLPGDSLAYGASAGHTMTNAGTTPLVLLVSALLADGRPGFDFGP